MGIDVNTQDPQQWQKSAVSSHDVGDGFIMRDRQADTVDLQFYYPGPTNFFVDAMCIPEVGQNEKLAEISLIIWSMRMTLTGRIWEKMYWRFSTLRLAASLSSIISIPTGISLQSFWKI